MEEKKRRSKWPLLNLVSVISGLVLFSIVFLASTTIDIHNAGMRLVHRLDGEMLPDDADIHNERQKKHDA